jgi:hypothetical protein
MTDYSRPFTGARWLDVLPRAAACPDLPARVLLHAGPPFRGAPPAPVFNAAVQALLFEDRTLGSAAAQRRVLDGEVELQPAQDHGIVTPLAQVVSASMLLIAVEQRGHIRYAPIVEGAAPALRFGSSDPQCLRRLRDAGAWVESVIAPTVRLRPLAVDDVIRIALASGDECHARTAAATEAMVTAMTGLAPAHAARLRASPAFVLTVLMAAAATALRCQDGDVEAIGGNGADFGIRRRGEGTWRRIPAQPPRGAHIAGMEAVFALGAIGDSAVIDFCGLGGQALQAAPVLAAEWNDSLPADALRRRPELIDPASGIVDAGRITRSALAPLINLAILDRDGSRGLIGRGWYSPQVELFNGAGSEPNTAVQSRASKIRKQKTDFR